MFESERDPVIGELSFAWIVVITFISAIEESLHLYRCDATLGAPSLHLLALSSTRFAQYRGFAQRSRNACRAFRKMRRGQGQGQVHSRIITLSISSCDSSSCAASLSLLYGIFFPRNILSSSLCSFEFEFVIIKYLYLYIISFFLFSL